MPGNAADDPPVVRNDQAIFVQAQNAVRIFLLVAFKNEGAGIRMIISAHQFDPVIPIFPCSAGRGDLRSVQLISPEVAPDVLT